MSRSSQSLLVLTLWVLSCSGPQTHDAGTVVRRADQPDVVYVDEEDAEMEAAMNQARTSLDGFIAELAAPRPSASYGIKVRFDENDATEFIWLTEVAYADGKFRGVAGNQGVDVDVQLGGAFTVPRDRVVDWLVVKNGKYRGGFTVRLIRNRMSPEDQQRADGQFGAVPES